MNRRNHHEAAMNMAGWCVVIAPTAVVMAQVAAAKLRRKKKARVS